MTTPRIDGWRIWELTTQKPIRLLQGGFTVVHRADGSVAFPTDTVPGRTYRHLECNQNSTRHPIADCSCGLYFVETLEAFAHGLRHIYCDYPIFFPHIVGAVRVHGPIFDDPDRSQAASWSTLPRRAEQLEIVHLFAPRGDTTPTDRRNLELLYQCPVDELAEAQPHRDLAPLQALRDGRYSRPPTAPGVSNPLASIDPTRVRGSLSVRGRGCP